MTELEETLEGVFMSDRELYIDGIGYKLNVSSVKLDTEFLYKYAERTENLNLVYELGGIFLNQEITLGTEDSNNEDFLKVWDILSKTSNVDGGTGHNVRIFTPMGYMTFLMYPNSVTLSLNRARLNNGSLAGTSWQSMTVKFIAIKPTGR